MRNVPWTSAAGSVDLCKENAMKLGSLGLSLKRLYRRLCPDEEPVLVTRLSIVEREVKPRPMIPFAP
jgi:hypothetical protein